MGQKTGFLIGLGAGYVLGARAGRQRYEDIRRWWGQFSGNPTVQRAAELPAHFLERSRVPIEQPEPELDDLLLPLGQRVQHGLQLLLQQDEARRVDGDDGFGVLDEVAEM